VLLKFWSPIRLVLRALAVSTCSIAFPYALSGHCEAATGSSTQSVCGYFGGTQYAPTPEFKDIVSGMAMARSTQCATAQIARRAYGRTDTVRQRWANHQD
jgi:hypothetical protein